MNLQPQRVPTSSQEANMSASVEVWWRVTPTEVSPTQSPWPVGSSHSAHTVLPNPVRTQRVAAALCKWRVVEWIGARWTSGIKCHRHKQVLAECQVYTPTQLLHFCNQTQVLMSLHLFFPLSFLLPALRRTIICIFTNYLRHQEFSKTHFWNFRVD